MIVAIKFQYSGNLTDESDANNRNRRIAYANLTFFLPTSQHAIDFLTNYSWIFSASSHQPSHKLKTSLPN